MQGNRESQIVIRAQVGSPFFKDTRVADFGFLRDSPYEGIGIFQEELSNISRLRQMVERVLPDILTRHCLLHPSFTPAWDPFKRTFSNLRLYDWRTWIFYYEDITTRLESMHNITRQRIGIL